MRIAVPPLRIAGHVAAALVVLSLTVATAPAFAAARRPVASTATPAASGQPAWRRSHVPLPPEVIGFSALSCGSTRDCLAVGDTGGQATLLLRTTDGGLHWARVAGRGLVREFGAVSCVSALRCMATTAAPGFDRPLNRVETTTDGGRNWRFDTALPTRMWGTLQCVASSVCYLFAAQGSHLAGGIERTADFGKHWASQQITGTNSNAVNAIHAVSCPTQADCVAVAGWKLHGHLSPIVTTTNAGVTWTVRSAPTAGQDLDAVSCGSASDCLAVGGEGLGADAVRTTNGGMTWLASTAPPVIGQAWTISCTAPGACLVGGQVGNGISNKGVIAKTTDQGAHWTVMRFGRAGIPDHLACPSATHCIATRFHNGADEPVPAGSVGWLVSGNDGASWRAIEPTMEIAELQSVSCPTGSTCFAAGGATGRSNDAIALRSGNSGETWQLVLATRRLQSLSSISCASRLQCVAVGTQNFGRGDAFARTTDGGSHWQVNAAPPGVAFLTTVSCPTTRICLALGLTHAKRAPTLILRSADGGRHWTVRPAPRPVAYLLGLSCASGRTCTAVGDPVHPPGPAIIERTTDGGLRWTKQAAPHGSTILDSVSCPDAQTCYAFSDTSPPTIDVTRDGGSHWVASKLTAGRGAVFPPTSLSCMARLICSGVAGNPPLIRGLVFDTTNGGSTWSAPAMPAGIASLLGISCKQGHCVAVGIDGQVIRS
jgi:photosystem II stability/assembly factor-like uncharacterized protein